MCVCVHLECQCLLLVARSLELPTCAFYYITSSSFSFCSFPLLLHENWLHNLIVWVICESVCMFNVDLTARVEKFVAIEMRSNMCVY